MKKNIKVYLAGPISGIRDDNKAAFRDAEARLKRIGYDVVNPHKLDHAENKTGDWGQYLRTCITAMMQCDAIALLPGWHDSEGAQLELSIA